MKTGYNSTPPDISNAREYLDVLGRRQYAVDGPRGTYLITRDRERDMWQVWLSTSLRTSSRHNVLPAAIQAASRLAGTVEGAR